MLLVMNLLSWIVLSFYGGYNHVISSLIIIITGAILYIIDSIYLKDAFKVSLNILFVFIGAIEFILSLIAPNRITDNWWLIIIILLIAVEAILLIVTNIISHKTGRK